MPDQEKEKQVAAVAVETTAAASAAGKAAIPAEGDPAQFFFGEPLVGFDPSEISGTLVVIEGMDGSGRSTQITLLQEWLESEGFAVQTSGLRRSNLVGRDIDLWPWCILAWLRVSFPGHLEIYSIRRRCWNI